MSNGSGPIKWLPKHSPGDIITAFAEDDSESKICIIKSILGPQEYEVEILGDEGTFWIATFNPLKDKYILTPESSHSQDPSF